ncbi:acyltransferase [Colwellia sp. E2M01]|uniref:acyltransferase family protein n=1 Tax=Colwellia sp. E2M01 TaxID=2841561 RepID=UPI001C0818EB|nr:acyltransferase [Colwellia sp. E2M01]MBU2869097.1 acyltransferase [Colwellia sp. E2M01]
MNTRYRSMDFLRTIAIMLVLLAHSILAYGAPSYLAPLQLGGIGVDLFFVLSGWLLGGALIREANREGSIDIKRFWMRRWLRTLPAYYVVLILSVAQRLITKDNVSFPIEYFIFTQNYYFPLEFFSISWSLAVEEQFYLLIAPLMAFLATKNNKYSTIILLVLLVIPFIFRELNLYSNPKETHVRIDGCVFGVLLAHIYYTYPAIWKKAADKALPISIIATFTFVFFFVARYFPEWGVQDPNKLLLAFIFGSWVLLANSSKEWSEMLYVPGAYYIATRSYSIYLLHPEVLALMKRIPIQLPFLIYFLLTIIGSLIVAECLYRLVEKPLMDSRERWSFSKVKG